MKPTPTAKLERTNDTVYQATTCVVRAVMVLSQGVQSKNTAPSSAVAADARGESGSGSRRNSQSSNTNHLENVKNVGLELRKLLAAVDGLIPAFPESTHRQVIKWSMYYLLFLEIQMIL